jgi:DNA-binding MarR family transcriptional regulator
MNNSTSKNADLPLAFQTERLQTLLREIHQCCEDRILFESHKFDLPQAELKCLLLFPGERYLTAKGIAQKMDVAKSRVTLIIEGLIRKDMVQRVEDPKDRRVKLISLTPKGLRKTEEIDLFVKGVHEKILLQMKPSERKAILSSLEILRACMEMVKAELE